MRLEGGGVAGTTSRLPSSLCRLPDPHFLLHTVGVFPDTAPNLYRTRLTTSGGRTLRPTTGGGVPRLQGSDRRLGAGYVPSPLRNRCVSVLCTTLLCKSNQFQGYSLYGRLSTSKFSSTVLTEVTEGGSVFSSALVLVSFVLVKTPLVSPSSPFLIPTRSVVHKTRRSSDPQWRVRGPHGTSFDSGLSCDGTGFRVSFRPTSTWVSGPGRRARSTRPEARCRGGWEEVPSYPKVWSRGSSRGSSKSLP